MTTRQYKAAVKKLDKVLRGDIIDIEHDLTIEANIVIKSPSTVVWGGENGVLNTVNYWHKEFKDTVRWYIRERKKLDKKYLKGQVNGKTKANT